MTYPRKVVCERDCSNRYDDDYFTPIGWTPMDKAPKDGTDILIKADDGDGPVVFMAYWGYEHPEEAMRYRGEKPCWCVSCSFNDEFGEMMLIDNPLGWQPVPDV